MTTHTTKKMKKHIGSAVGTTILATALLSASSVASAKSDKCGDIVKAGKNTCAVKALGISCQGNANKDNLPGAWIKVPEGTCANIVAICTGKAEAPEGTSEKKLAKACSKVAEQTDESVLGGRLVNNKGEYLDENGKVIGS